ncbi:MAG TPA: leucyl/phenylalanyl-tRNA--protein transferase [Fimbriiglobus sp.]|nr:leucyl/phenylalanyl-tRNA--protein transferase [Fimbriiglobus sp.]
MKDGKSHARPWVSPELAGQDGLVGIGGDLRPATLLRAYTDGVFPWFSLGDPILWWSPDPRSVIELGGLHVSRSLARTIRKGTFRVTVNRAFGDVVRGCATARPDGTWITDPMVAAYETLHRLGHAHSVEAWVRPGPASGGCKPPVESTIESATGGLRPPLAEDEDWTLAGGIYGVAVGALFAGESMFYRVSDASKVALVALVARLRERGYELFDVQMRTDHTARMGATDMPRPEYLRRLRDAVRKSAVRFD